MRRLLPLLFLLSAGRLATAAEPSAPVGDQVRPVKASPLLTKIAERHWQHGLELYRAGELAGARVEFQTGYELTKLPTFLHNLSMTAQLEGNYPEAIALEERFLREAEAELSEKEADEARGRIVRLREQLPSTPAKNPGVEQRSPAPTRAPIGLETSYRRIDSKRVPVGAVVLLSLGGGLAVAGIGCGAAALATERRIESGEPLYERELGEALDRGRSLSTAGIGLGVVGGAALAAGTVWALTVRLRR